jgi:hypothetical protein
MSILDAIAQSKQSRTTQHVDIMTVAQTERIAEWLNGIGEFDFLVVEETMERCKTDFDARRYFLMRAEQ